MALRKTIFVALIAGASALCIACHQAPNLMAKPWVDQEIDAMRLSVPWPLEQHALPMTEARESLTATTTIAHEEPTVTVLASHLSYAAGNHPDIDSAAEVAIAALKQAVGNANCDGKKFETEVAGLPAMEVDAKLKERDGSAWRSHIVLFSDETEEYVVTMMCRDDLLHADEAWRKLRASIKLAPPPAS